MNRRLFLALGVLVLVLAGGVRLPRLGERSVWLDEAKVANHARQPVAAMVHKTRLGGSSPVAYPLLLHLVQRVDRGALAVRLPSVLASLAAVAVVLALARVGFEPGAALVAAAILAVSPSQVRYAQEAREYALAVLVAAALVAGTVACAAGARRARFAVPTLLAVVPLVQYGLVLLASAVLPVTAAVVWRREGARAALRLAAWGMAGLGAGSLLTLALTLRGQWRHTGAWYLQDALFDGPLRDLAAVLAFVGSRLPDLLGYLTLGEGSPILVLPAAGLLLVAARKGPEQARSVLGLAVLSLATVAGAAVLHLYPLGPVRQDLFLAPVVAAAVGAGWAALAALMPERSRALSTAALTVGVLAAGGLAIARADPYREVEDISSVIAGLDAHRRGDLVYVYYGARPALRFYGVDDPGFVYGGGHRSDPARYATQFRELVGVDPTVVWLVFSHVYGGEDRRLLEDLDGEWSFETVVDAEGARLVRARRRSSGERPAVEPDRSSARRFR